MHFFTQEAKVAIPILALADRLGAGAFIRGEIIPLLPVRLAAWFEELTTGKTYPMDAPLGPPPGRRFGGGLPVSSADQQLGMQNKQIGNKLFISEKTVKTHANHVFRKLGVTSRVQATLAFQTYQRARRAGGAGRAKK